MTKKYDNSGSLGKNERRENDKQPTHSGRCTIDGKEYWISAWVREGNNGKFFSLAFKPKEARNSPPPQREQVPGPKTDDGFYPDDEIPFVFAFAVPVAALLASMVFGFGGYIA